MGPDREYGLVSGRRTWAQSALLVDLPGTTQMLRYGGFLFPSLITVYPVFLLVPTFSITAPSEHTSFLSVLGGVRQPHRDTGLLAWFTLGQVN